MKRLHITHDRIQIRVAQLHGRHQRAGLDRVWVLNPKTKVFGVFSAAPEAMVARLIKCVRSGPKRPFAGVPATVWQFMQALLSKTCLPATALGVLNCGLLLGCAPRRQNLQDCPPKRAAASLRAALRSTARTGQERFRCAAGPSTFCSDGWESGRSCLRVPGPRSCGRCQQTARSRNVGVG